MENQRFITVKDGKGKKLYEGEDKRIYSKDYPRCALGIPISDWIKAIIYSAGILVVLIRMQYQVDELVKVSSSFRSYMESADTFNSAIFGTPFKGGSPANVNFTYKGNGGNVSGVIK